MSNSRGESSQRQRILHMRNAAAGLALLVILDIILLAVGIYLALQNNEIATLVSVLLLVSFVIIAVAIYKAATAEEREEEQYESTTPSQ